MAKKTDVNQFDFCIVVDTTGSMGGFISAAKKQMVEMVKQLSDSAEIDIRLGLVEYRDHKPQDEVLTIDYPFVGDTEKMQQQLQRLSLGYGGDHPEAVYDGLAAACGLEWREHAARIAVLVGDAPPHGVGCRGDAFPDGCPCGDDVASITFKLEQAGITLYAIALERSAEDSFREMTSLSGGILFTSYGGAVRDTGIKEMKQVLATEFSNIELDRKVLDLWPDKDIHEIAEKLEVKPFEISSSIGRIVSRGLVEEVCV